MTSQAVTNVYNTMLYFMGPFFCNPTKPILQNLWCNTGYQVAYEHFKRDHKKPNNLALHAVALCLQLSSNFALLHRLDELIGSSSWGLISGSTAALWALLLAPQRQAPLKARALAIAMIGFAYAVRKKVAERWDILTWANGIVEAMHFKTYWIGALPRSLRKSYLPKESAQFARLLMLRWAMQAVVTLSPLRGAMSKKGHKGLVAAALLPALVASSYKPFERTTTRGAFLSIFNYHYLGWLMSLVTGEKVFFLHSCAFGASNVQGIAHMLSEEMGTLPQLRNPHWEFAHCSYFPVLAHPSLSISTTAPWSLPGPRSRQLRRPRDEGEPCGAARSTTAWPVTVATEIAIFLAAGRPWGRSVPPRRAVLANWGSGRAAGSARAPVLRAGPCWGFPRKPSGRHAMHE